jgi:hypothetical protein
MSRRARRIVAVLALVAGLPLWIMLAVTLVGLFERPPVLLELAVYVLAGVLWAIPLKPLFKGIGRE